MWADARHLALVLLCAFLVVGCAKKRDRAISDRELDEIVAKSVAEALEQQKDREDSPARGRWNDRDEPERRTTQRPVVPSTRRALTVSGRLAIPEGLAILSSLPVEQQFVAGLGIGSEAVNGNDVYSAKVKVWNTGTVPLKVYPQNIHFRVDGRLYRAGTMDHADAFQTTVLQPNFYVDKIVFFTAPQNLQSFNIVYDDETIEINYD